MELEQILVESAKKAGEYIRKNAFDFGDATWKKKDDPVTIIDKGAEKILREEISRLCPGSNFVGEEYGYESNAGRYTWIMDPIDGTKSFIRGDFLSALSIGVEDNCDLVGGVVYDFMKDIMYVSVGRDAKMMHAGKILPLGKPQVMSKKYISYDHLDALTLSKLKAPDTSVKRHEGSIALALAQIANGNSEAIIVGTYESNGYSPWDVAGGVAILRASGYCVLDLKGNNYNYMNGSNGLLAVRPVLEDELLSRLGIKT